MTHKWDYEPHPWNNKWENTPYYIRWPLATIAIIVAIFFLTAPIHPWLMR